jgi:hypothetical protein
MPVVKRPVKPVEVTYVCDGCGQGMLEHDGAMDAESGAQDHRCLICDHRQTFFWERYPRIDHIGVDEVLPE